MSDDLVKRLRQSWDADRSIMSQTGRWMAEREAAADRIEELEERLKAAQDDAKEAEAYAGELEAVYESIKAKLAACQKYRDAYAECDRLGTQSVRDLEAKLAKAIEALRITDKWLRELDMYANPDYHLAPSLQKVRDTLAELTGGKDE